MAPQVAPFGTWSSPITSAFVAKSGVSFDDVLVDPISVRTGSRPIYHIEKRPSEAGRNVLVNTATRKDVLGKGWNARSGVQEYGGASTVVFGGVAYFSNFADGRVYKVDCGREGSEPVPVTPENKNHRFANFAAHPTAPHLIVSILEDHTHPSPSEVVTTLVTIDTETSTVHPLVSGADFYAAPTFNPEGTRLAWVQWNHPDMPWDGAQVYVADVISEGETLALQNTKKVKGEGKKESAVRPLWVTSNVLLFSCDESGFQNPWIIDLDGSPSDPLPVLSSQVSQDFADPDWTLGEASFAVLTDSSALCTAFRDGRSVLYLLGLKNGSLKEIATPYTIIKKIRTTGERSAVLLGLATDSPMAVVNVVLDANGEAQLTTFAGGDLEDSKSDTMKVDKALFSAPRPLSFKGREGLPLYVVFYPPTNPEFTGPQSERPPCIVYAHGGPTGLTDQGLSLRKQFFTSRGFAWVDVNYGGSAGYGRQYIERLDGQWGVIDVSDCIDAARALASPSFGEIDAARVVITGGSAGGYTVLQTLCSVPSSVIAAGTASYGISNLFTLVEDTHKFESKYMDKLLGGPADKIPHIFRARSPLFHAERIESPLLILQGADDMVVPPSQAEDMMKVIRDRGGRVEYTLFEGEGHGWRKAETIEAALERELSFYLDVLGLQRKKSK